MISWYLTGRPYQRARKVEPLFAFYVRNCLSSPNAYFECLSLWLLTVTLERKGERERICFNKAILLASNFPIAPMINTDT